MPAAYTFKMSEQTNTDIVKDEKQTATRAGSHDPENSAHGE